MLNISYRTEKYLGGLVSEDMCSVCEDFSANMFYSQTSAAACMKSDLMHLVYQVYC